mgnify:FL=1
MAAAALRLELGADGERVEVRSGGTSAREGDSATPLAVRVAGASGVDLSGHRALRVTREMLESADLVLAMESEHLRWVLNAGADPRKSHVLSEWPAPGDASLEISDPFGASIEAYEEGWRRIRCHLERVVPEIREALRARSA